MRRPLYGLFLIFALALAFMAAAPTVHPSRVVAAPHRGQAATAAPAVTDQRADRHQRQIASFASLPIRFEPNVGQAPQPAEYSARGSGYFVALTEQAAVLDLPPATPGERGRSPVTHDAARLRLHPLHANATPRLHPEQLQNSVSNYFVGTDHSRWRRNVANYAAVRYEQIYPGIDWVVYGNPQQLEYDFVVAPGADPRRIKLQVEGAQALSVDGNGDLLVKVQERTVRQLRPVIYQAAADGRRHAVQGHYVLSHGAFSFALGGYDRSRALIIDPALVYSSYFSANALAIATDGQGNAYIAGTTGITGTGLPTQMPLQSADLEKGFATAFIAKLNAAGTQLAYSTYLGGSGNSRSGNLGFCGRFASSEAGEAAGNGGDGATALAVDAAGNAYLAGYTSSSDFPTVSPLQATNHASVNQGSNAFLAKLNPTGDALVYSTYLGGSGLAGAVVTGDMANAIAVDLSGNAYVAGITTSTDFPTVTPFQASSQETTRTTGFVAKVNAAGSALLYSSYLGGSGGNDGSGIGDCANAIAVDASGNAYVAGETSSTDFPVAGAFQAANAANGSVAYAGTGFLTKVSSAGNTLSYSTYLGGSGRDAALAVAVDTLGDAYVAGYTLSADFPLANALQPSAKATTNAFVSKFNPAGSGLIYSTYLGGSAATQANALAVDTAGNAYVAGTTYSADFAVLDAVQSANNAAAKGGNNAFVSVLDPTGSALNFSTYLGGSAIEAVFPCPTDASSCPTSYIGDSAVAIAVDTAGDIYLAGPTYSTDFPTLAAFQAQPGASFVTKISSTSSGSSASGAGTTTAGQADPPAASGGGGALGWDMIMLLSLALAPRWLGRPDSTDSRAT